jgi:two-component system, chemotaxis family, protein-glutamate methylesterase/glutaminase
LKYLEHNKIVLIGASTGGPAHIEKILGALKEPLEYTLIIAQHMGSEFLPSFVRRLSLKTKHNIVLCEDQQVITPGYVYIATNQCSIHSDGNNLKFSVLNSAITHFNPDINHLFTSAATLNTTYDMLAILLTGIGDDGVKGCKLLAEHGATCIAESEESAIVYGIPARAKEQVQDINILNLDQIIDAIKTFGSSNV